MKKLLLLSAAATGLLLSSCAPRCRVVEHPLIETANTRALDIVKVELSDTATVVHVEAYYRPRNWIRIDAKTYLQIPARRFLLTGAEGIVPDSLFWMPDSGRASFALRFPPLPRGVKSFDLIESDCDDCFKVYGVDLTGKTEYATYPDGLPQSLRTAPKDGPLPDPILRSGTTSVNLHLLGFREGLSKQAVFFINSVLGGQERKTAAIDPRTGIATLQFPQYGSGPIYVRPDMPDALFGQFWTAPGETIDVYFDLREMGRRIVQRRSGEALWSGSTLYTTGTYADLNRQYDLDARPIALELYSGNFADYRMTADEYTEFLAAKYRTLADSIARSDKSAMMKEMNLLTLQNETVCAIAACNSLLEHNYRSVQKCWEERLDRTFAQPGPSHYAAIAALFDVNNPKLLMGARAHDYLVAVSSPQIDWASILHADAGPAVDLRKGIEMVAKARADRLTQEDIDRLRAMKEPFYAEACVAIRDQVRRELEQLADVRIEPTPDVPLDELFDAIIAPVTGRVALVDFWNTWCGPCQSSLERIEPMKTGSLQSDEIVWIYIANETSPLVTYKKQIGKIAGRHYRLDERQWRHLCEQFGIDGIPSYVLVERDGSYALRNDLRDHEKLEKTLRKRIE